jgi:hemoglobin
MRIRLVLAALAATAVFACGGGSKKDDTMGGGGGGSGGTETDMAKKPLIDRLGGKDGIAKVVDLFVAKVGADNRINSFFVGKDLDHLKLMLTEQICDAASGGTVCKYSGKSMEEVHRGMGVKKDHFTALVEDLVAAMRELGVGDAEQQEILSVLGPMEPTIVEQ